MSRRRQLTADELERPYGRLHILADTGRVVPVRCDCGRETRKNKSAVLRGNVRSCGKGCALGSFCQKRGPMPEAEKQKRRDGSTRAHKEKREFLMANLSQAEREQVQRIIQSRTGEARRHRELMRDAVDLVIRDRNVGQMVCHSGTAETI